MQTKSQKRFPYVSWDQVMAFDPLKPETATASPVVNGILEAIPVVRPLDLKYIGLYLGLPSTALSGALFCATGLRFTQFLDKWRVDKLKYITTVNPTLKGDLLAKHLGFYDRSALWLFMKRKKLLKRDPRREHENDVLYWMELMGTDEELKNEYKQKLWQNGIQY